MQTTLELYCFHLLLSYTGYIPGQMIDGETDSRHIFRSRQRLVSYSGSIYFLAVKAGYKHFFAKEKRSCGLLCDTIQSQRKHFRSAKNISKKSSPEKGVAS
jgi:hypothetical protein